MGGYGTTGDYGTGLYKGEYQLSGGVYQYPQNRINYLTGICLRLGIKPEHGLGWSYYENGVHWLWPEPNVLPIEVEDDNQQMRSLVLDERAGRFYEFPTRDGPAGSGLVATYLDKEDQYGGAEIPCKIIFPEQTGTREHEMLDHMESHAYLRPQKESDRNTGGHTVLGYRNAFEIDFGFYKMGELIEHVRSINIPDTGEIGMDRRTEAPRLSPFIETKTSSFKLVGIDNFYNQKDMAGSRTQKQMKEGTWQFEYSEPLLWYTRGYNPLLNRAKGTNFTGTFFTETTGPDQNSSSAIVLTALDYLSDIITTNLSGDFTIQFSINAASYGFEIISSSTGAMRIYLTAIGTDNHINFNDGVNIISQLLPWTNTNWATIKISRSGGDLLISQDGALLNTIPLTTIVTYGGTIRINTGGVLSIFDVSVFNKLISNEAFLYYYNDLINNHGDACFMPPY